MAAFKLPDLDLPDLDELEEEVTPLEVIDELDGPSQEDSELYELPDLEEEQDVEEEFEEDPETGLEELDASTEEDMAEGFQMPEDFTEEEYSEEDFVEEPDEYGRSFGEDEELEVFDEDHPNERQLTEDEEQDREAAIAALDAATNKRKTGKKGKPEKSNKLKKIKPNGSDDPEEAMAANIANFFKTKWWVLLIGIVFLLAIIFILPKIFGGDGTSSAKDIKLKKGEQSVVVSEYTYEDTMTATITNTGDMFSDAIILATGRGKNQDVTCETEILVLDINESKEVIFLCDVEGEKVSRWKWELKPLYIPQK